MDSTLGAGSSLGGTLLRAAVQISGDDKPTATVENLWISRCGGKGVTVALVRQPVLAATFGMAVR